MLWSARRKEQRNFLQKDKLRFGEKLCLLLRQLNMLLNLLRQSERDNNLSISHCSTC